MIIIKKRGVRLSASIRKYIRENKSKIRRQYGSNSTQEEEFLGWIKKEKELKITAIRQK